MGLFSGIKNAFSRIKKRKKREEEWAERFTNEPEFPPRNLPLDTNPNSHFPSNQPPRSRPS